MKDSHRHERTGRSWKFHFKLGASQEEPDGFLNKLVYHVRQSLCIDMGVKYTGPKELDEGESYRQEWAADAAHEQAERALEANAAAAERKQLEVTPPQLPEAQAGQDDQTGEQELNDALAELEGLAQEAREKGYDVQIVDEREEAAAESDAIAEGDAAEPG